jgi:HD-GYP domain-containing protein (c-di-GMP phosphodiesterase class II)
MTKFTTVRSLLSALAKAMNLINPDMENHHQETAYLAYQIGMEMGLHTEDLHLIASAALLHDVGTIVMPQRENLAEIESHRREIAHIGAEMIRDLEPFEMIANIIELCQNGWRENVEFAKTKACSRAVHGNIEQCIDVAECIHLADVISALWDEEGEILNQVPMIREAVEAGRGTEFSDKAVDAFQRISQREFVWMDFVLNPTFLMFFTGDMHDLSLEETVELTQLMSRIIDFRSSFTAMHSAGVAASAKELARLAGMNEKDCMKMEIAGNLHDVGKLRVPNEILEKPGKLTEEEFNKIKEHPYYTRLILMDIEGFEEIADWAGFHHEKLNGRGYPFHFDSGFLSLGSRIMTVADIFSAITEERPYRKPMSREQAMKVMWENVERGEICRDIVQLLEDNYDAVNDARKKKSQEAGARYFATHQTERTE